MMCTVVVIVIIMMSLWYDDSQCLIITQRQIYKCWGPVWCQCGIVGLGPWPLLPFCLIPVWGQGPDPYFFSVWYHCGARALSLTSFLFDTNVGPWPHTRITQGESGGQSPDPYFLQVSCSFSSTVYWCPSVHAAIDTDSGKYPEKLLFRFMRPINLWGGVHSNSLKTVNLALLLQTLPSRCLSLTTFFNANMITDRCKMYCVILCLTDICR